MCFQALFARSYAKYHLEIEPKDAEKRLISIDDNKNNQVRVGKNILATGHYELILKKEGFIDLKTNFLLPISGLSHQFTLKPQTFTLKLVSKESPFDLYLNQQHILTVSDKSVVISNIPQGHHELYVSTEDNNFFHKTFNVQNEKSYSIKVNPRHYTKVIVFSTLLGLLPGLNYFIHIPKSTAGFVFPSLILNYFFLTAYLLQASGINIVDANFIRPSDSQLPSSNLIKIGIVSGLITSSLIHSFFSFLGTKKDLDDLRKRHNSRLSFSLTMDPKNSFYLGLNYNY